MNLSGGYIDGIPDDEGISLIKYAFAHGITFFDTADIYGANANEVLIGKVTIFFSPLLTLQLSDSGNTVESLSECFLVLIRL